MRSCIRAFLIGFTCTLCGIAGFIAVGLLTHRVVFVPMARVEAVHHALQTEGGRR